MKTPMQLWIADNRKRLGATDADVAAWTGVTPDTVRGWESRGRPSQDAIAVLERKFGQPAPQEQDSAGDVATIVRALAEATEVNRRLAETNERLLGRLAEHVEAQTRMARDSLTLSEYLAATMTVLAAHQGREGFDVAAEIRAAADDLQARRLATNGAV